jgi:sulfite reductase (NADPH) flavoprotein alpha-component
LVRIYRAGHNGVVLIELGRSDLLKKALFQLHRLIGISAGIVLAFNGITGALMAFGPQLRAHYGPTVQRVAPTGSAPLAVEELYHRCRR